ncbi:MAG: DUF3784 domain-containing protein [Gammaproteobacteria bacterium]
MTAKLVEVLVMEGIALLMFWFAYLIGIKKKLGLIAGYNEKSAHYVTDKDGLARLVARLCLLTGIAAAAMPIATSIWGSTTTGFATCIGAFAGFIAGVTGLTALQARDYVARPGAPWKS